MRTLVRSRRRHKIRKRRGGERGSATVEIAVAMPIVMLLLMLVVQAGVYWHTRAVAVSAAHKGLDALRVEQGTVPDAQAVTHGWLDRNAGALRGRDVDVARGPDRVEVTVTGQVTSLIFGADIFPVTVTASAPLEQPTP